MVSSIACLLIAQVILVIWSVIYNEHILAKHGISKTIILLPMIYIHIPPYVLISGIFFRNPYESVRMRRWYVLVKLADNEVHPHFLTWNTLFS